MGRFTLIFSFLMGISSVSAAEHVQWEQGQEISVELTSGKERKVIFPEMVRLGVKNRYETEFKHSLIDNMLYLTPVMTFSEKLTLQGLDSGRFYILEASVSESSVKAEDDLVIQIKGVGNKNHDNEVSDVQSLPFQGVKLTPIDLVQYAAQNLYAPSQALIEPTPGIKRVAVKEREVPYLYRGGMLRSEVVAGWAGGGIYVTALKLSNVSTQTVYFEPCRIRGGFISATPQFGAAEPMGSDKNFTIVYLISDKPFDVAVQNRELLCV